MPRSWPERLAKRVPRLIDGLNKMEDKGRQNDPHFEKMLCELADLCSQMAETQEKARAELHDIETKVIFHRREMERKSEQFKKDRAALDRLAEETRRKLKEGQEDLKRQAGEVSKERAELAAEKERTQEARRRYQNFMKSLKRASDKLEG